MRQLVVFLLAVDVPQVLEDPLRDLAVYFPTARRRRKAVFVGLFILRHPGTHTPTSSQGSIEYAYRSIDYTIPLYAYMGYIHREGTYSDQPK